MPAPKSTLLKNDSANRDPEGEPVDPELVADGGHCRNRVISLSQHLAVGVYVTPRWPNPRQYDSDRRGTRKAQTDPVMLNFVRISALENNSAVTHR